LNAVEFQSLFERVRAEIARAIVGQTDLVEHVLLAAFSRGHVLIEGPPGLGKTLLVRVLGQVLGCDSRRIQFTPDLMPSDVTGGNVFQQQRGVFEFQKGPVFTQLLLADEINRAPAKTQSALLEAMQEQSVTIDGQTRALPTPFLVLATQNPIESQGTYPLPEAQLDRFLFKIEVAAPGREVERAILANHLAGFDPSSLDRMGLVKVLDHQSLHAWQHWTRTVTVDPSVLDYITNIVAATREHGSVFFGASPRGSLALLFTAQTRAASQGRTFVIPDDVKVLAPAVLRHRIGLEPDAEIEGLRPDDVIAAILRDVRVPATVAV